MGLRLGGGDLGEPPEFRITVLLGPNVRAMLQATRYKCQKIQLIVPCYILHLR